MQQQKQHDPSPASHSHNVNATDTKQLASLYGHILKVAAIWDDVCLTEESGLSIFSFE